MVEIGKMNALRIVKEVDFGLYLDGGDKGEILLPTRYVPEQYEIDGMLDVFIYTDSEDRIIATTEKPFAMVGDIAFLEVVAVNEIGAFLNWGLLKDLLVPFREQRTKMQVGESHIVAVYLDEESERIAASAKLDEFLEQTSDDYEVGQEVFLQVWSKTPIGFKVIINDSHLGMLYKDEVFQNLERGQRMKGFIKKVRDDKKIDLSLHKPGFGKVDELGEKILKKLKSEGGFIPVTDKSHPELIYSIFGESKKTFKKAIGGLYKKRLITLEEKGIRLAE
jgi:predicted RNA-binding protein (virulence factor B family)